MLFLYTNKTIRKMKSNARTSALTSIKNERDALEIREERERERERKRERERERKRKVMISV